MTARCALARVPFAALFVYCTAIAGCEDRSPPDDVPLTKSGGIARVPTIGTSSNVGQANTSAGQGGGSGVSGGPPQGSGIGGTGGSAGIPGIGGTGGAGIPGIGGNEGSAGIPGAFPGNAATGGVGMGGAGPAGPLGIGGALGGVGTNLAPAASFTVSPQCISDVQTAVTLASSSVDPDGDSLRCSWVVPGAVPNASDDCTVTVTFFDPVESQVGLFVDDGTQVSSTSTTIALCPPAAPANPPAVP